MVRTFFQQLAPFYEVREPVMSLSHCLNSYSDVMSAAFADQCWLFSVCLVAVAVVVVVAFVSCVCARVLLVDFASAFLLCVFERCSAFF